MQKLYGPSLSGAPYIKNGVFGALGLRWENNGAGDGKLQTLLESRSRRSYFGQVDGRNSNRCIVL